MLRALIVQSFLHRFPQGGVLVRRNQFSLARSPAGGPQGQGPLGARGQKSKGVKAWGPWNRRIPGRRGLAFLCSATPRDVKPVPVPLAQAKGVVTPFSFAPFSSFLLFCSAAQRAQPLYDAVGLLAQERGVPRNQRAFRAKKREWSA